MGSSGAREWDRGPNPIRLVEVGLGDNSLGPHGPNFNKPFLSLSGKLSSSFRAPTEPAKGPWGWSRSFLPSKVPPPGSCFLVV